MAKILIVEDDPILSDLYNNTFLLGGFTTHTAKNGLEGFETAVKEKPDIIFLDIMMPKMNGIELIGELKKNEVTKNIPVIILSNFSDQKLAQEAITKGALAYIIKSDYEPKEVIQVANKWLPKKTSS
jgi:CheY-like chemotaxis protein